MHGHDEENGSQQDAAVHVSSADRVGKVGGMEPPEWIRDALDASGLRYNYRANSACDQSRVAAELLDRLPLDRMVVAVCGALERTLTAQPRSLGCVSAESLARTAVQVAVAVMAAPYEDVTEFSNIYADALNALQTAGVPWTRPGSSIPMSLGDRIRWISRERTMKPRAFNLADMVSQDSAIRGGKIEP